MACSFRGVSDRSENTAREEEKSMERCDRRAVNSPFGRTTTAQKKVPVKVGLFPPSSLSAHSKEANHC